MSSSPSPKPGDLLALVGGVAGLLYGMTIAARDPAASLIVGAFIGVAMGGLLGSVAAHTLSAWQKSAAAAVMAALGLFQFLQILSLA